MLAFAATNLDGLSLAGIFGAKVAKRATRITLRPEKLAPFIMIAAGIYILLDTANDVF